MHYSKGAREHIPPPLGPQECMLIHVSGYKYRSALKSIKKGDDEVDEKIQYLSNVLQMYLISWDGLTKDWYSLLSFYEV